MTERSTIAFPVGREKTCRRANTCRPESNRKMINLFSKLNFNSTKESMNKKIIQRISLLILLFVLPIAYPVTDIHAQDVRVTIRMEKVRMEQVMNEIERQTKYLFGSAENVDVKRIVTVQVVNRPLQEALDAMLRGTNVSYTVQGSNIVLKNGRSEAEAKKPAVISGVVRDAAGNPVVGAAVVVKGTTIGISTDSEGRFSLQVPPRFAGRSGNQLFGVCPGGCSGRQRHSLRHYAQRG